MSIKDRQDIIDVAFVDLMTTRKGNEVNLVITTVDTNDGYLNAKNLLEGKESDLIEAIIKAMALSGEFDGLIRKVIHVINIKDQLPAAAGCLCPDCTKKRNSVNPQNN